MHVVCYLAHSAPEDNHKSDVQDEGQPLAEHLANTARLARQLAEDANTSDCRLHELAEWCGAFHDLGKYSEAFQRRIRGDSVRCPHAIHGASYLFSGDIYRDSPSAALLASWAIAGHHAGLANPYDSGELSLSGRLIKYMDEAKRLAVLAKSDCDVLRALLATHLPMFAQADQPGFDLIARMLFSCLVDADRLDSGGRSWQPKPLLAEKKLTLLQQRLAELTAKAPPSTVNVARQQVLGDCLSAASKPGNLFSLTVPTGGGKTLASMAFALRRAALHPEQYRRVIVVIPFLSIIEQSAAIYSGIFGDDEVLEHHSGSGDRLKTQATPEGETIYVPSSAETNGKQANDEDKQRPRDETENWDAPLIVTTSVRFFESLFSNRPSDLRRVHNIARSIVILDEVQTLPRNLLAPLLKMIEELSQKWGCTFVFATATQPALQRIEGAARDARLAPGSLQEIIAEPEQLRTKLKRVQVEWQIAEPQAWPEIAQKMLGEEQSLCIVNLRDHASALYDEVCRQAEHAKKLEGLFHLSTRMCAAHRLATLAKIRQRLERRQSCHVVSTQLVEAGVDVDFPLVLRAIAPLDSVIQAAGRADREGHITANLGRPGGRVIVFRAEDGRLPLGGYKEATAITTAIVADAASRDVPVQVDSAAELASFYERYYGDSEQGVELQKLRTKAGGFAFATLAEKFEMIGNRTRDVYVPYGEKGKRLLEKLRRIGLMTAELRRALQRYSVGLYPYEFEKAKGVLSELREGSEIWLACEGSYDDTKGLKAELEAQDFVQ